MATVGTFLQSMRRESGDRPPDPVLAMDWLTGRYAEALERAPFQFLSKEGTITTVAKIATGTVTVVNGSATVTESVSNANSWSSTLIGRFFRIQGDEAFYEITNFGNVNPDTLTLSRVYEGTSATLASYSIWARYYSLASDVRHVVGMFTSSGPVSQLQEVSQSDMDSSFPSRPEVGNPAAWAMAGRDSSNNLRVELYPAPDDAGAVYYRYIQATPALSGGESTLLPQVPFALLRAGWLSDYWGWRGASGGDESSITLKLAQASRYEAEFQKRVSEMIARECLALSPKRIRLKPQFTRHRLFQKFGNGSAPPLP